MNPLTLEQNEWCKNMWVEHLRLQEVSPPGWKGSVKAMKKHKEIDNPFALAWSMKKKGNKPHYKNKDGKPVKKKKGCNCE